MPAILAIDDETIILKYLKSILSELGYEVRTASDCSDGLKQAASNDVKLIICDLNMPGDISGMNGVKKLRALRPDCPIVILTGYPSSERVEEAQAANVEFLTKPFEIPFLTSMLKRLLPLEKKPESAAGGHG